MKVTFGIYWPGGNTTALVSEAVPQKLHARIAKAIIKHRPDIEQVGFILPPKKSAADLHLQMMGGEFCGNAARCAALYSAGQKNKSLIRLTVSGYPKILTAQIKGVSVNLKIPSSFVKTIQPQPQGWLVSMYGIRFFVTEAKLSRTQILAFLKKYQAGFPAIGIIYLEKKSRHFAITPWVKVLKTKTLTLETGCASGTLAAAMVLNSKNKTKKNFSITQPSGDSYKVRFSSDRKTLSLFGPVKLDSRSGSVKI